MRRGSRERDKDDKVSTNYSWASDDAARPDRELKPANRFVDYAMHRVRLLRHFGIEPYVVFDGGPLPAKKVTEVARAQ